VSIVLTAIGTLILLLSLAGVLFGVYMSTHPKTRQAGKLFAVWWVPTVAAAAGVFMRDAVTFVVGLVCFLIAGGILLLENSRSERPTARRKGSARRPSSARTTRENRTGKGYRRAAS
jgi:hypothetical protein